MMRIKETIRRLPTGGATMAERGCPHTTVLLASRKPIRLGDADWGITKGLKVALR
jgi:hypothetical protein